MPSDARSSRIPEHARQLFSQARDEVLLAAELALRAEITPPEREARLRRIAYGVSLPFAVFRRVWRDPLARRDYLRVVVPQLAVVAGVAFLLFGVWRDDDVKKTHGFAHAFAVISMVVTILSVAEWIVVAFSNDYHDHLSFRAATLSGVPHEQPTRAARVRLDWGWLWSKGKRKIRGFLLIGVGLPLLAILELAPVGGHWFYAAGVLLWSFYWVSVFALANTPLAWHPPSVPREPFFLRGVEVVGNIPLVGTFARLYARVARRITGSVHHACQAFEDEAPYEAIGLAATRFLFGLPGLYIVTRPLFPVAATHAILARRYPADAGSSCLVASAVAPVAPVAAVDPIYATDANQARQATAAREAVADPNQAEGRIDITNP